jgi:hypothetical protein
LGATVALFEAKPLRPTARAVSGRTCLALFLVFIGLLDRLSCRRTWFAAERQSPSARERVPVYFGRERLRDKGEYARRIAGRRCVPK